MAYTPAEPHSNSHAVNDEATLFDVASREIWQCEVSTSDNTVIGRAVRQIVEPNVCSVRYLVIYDATATRRFLLPATCVIGAAPGTILCNTSANLMDQLPDYDDHLSRDEELHVHKCLGCCPYWVEEATDSYDSDTPR